MTTRNKITKEELGDELWNSIIDDWYDSIKDHRKGSSFFITLIYEINEEFFPDQKDLWGFWITAEYLTWSDNYGLDDKPTVLYRVEQKEKTIVEKYWERVE